MRIGHQDYLDIMDEFFSKENLDFNLENWEKDWLHNSGVNHMRCFREEDGQMLLSINFLQTCISKSVANFRQHNTDVLFYYDDQQPFLNNFEVFDKAYSSFELFKVRKPSAVLIDPAGQNYLKTRLDKVSFQYLQKNLQVRKQKLLSHLQQ